MASPINPQNDAYRMITEAMQSQNQSKKELLLTTLSEGTKKIDQINTQNSEPFRSKLSNLKELKKIAHEGIQMAEEQNNTLIRLKEALSTESLNQNSDLSPSKFTSLNNWLAEESNEFLMIRNGLLKLEKSIISMLKSVNNPT